MRLIDADSLENFAHEPTFGTDEVISDWVNQVFSDPVFVTENEEQLEELCWKVLEGCMNVIKTEPTVQQWIPCSERLPEEYEVVLLCISHPSKPEVQAYYTAYMGNNLWWLVGTNHSISVKPTASAWMPLPEPWEEE